MGRSPAALAAVPLASAEGRMLWYRPRLCRFYELYNPSKLCVVDNMLRAAAPHEESLFAALVQTYGAEPGPHREQQQQRQRGAVQQSDAAAAAALRVRLEEFYAAHCPAKRPDAARLAERYAGMERELFAVLAAKYGGDRAGAEGRAAPAGVPPPARRPRLSPPRPGSRAPALPESQGPAAQGPQPAVAPAAAGAPFDSWPPDRFAEELLGQLARGRGGDPDDSAAPPAAEAPAAAAGAERAPPPPPAPAERDTPSPPPPCSESPISRHHSCIDSWEALREQQSAVEAALQRLCGPPQLLPEEEQAQQQQEAGDAEAAEAEAETVASAAGTAPARPGAKAGRRGPAAPSPGSPARKSAPSRASDAVSGTTESRSPRPRPPPRKPAAPPVRPTSTPPTPPLNTSAAPPAPGLPAADAHREARQRAAQRAAAQLAAAAEQAAARVAATPASADLAGLSTSRRSAGQAPASPQRSRPAMSRAVSRASPKSAAASGPHASQRRPAGDQRRVSAATDAHRGSLGSAPSEAPPPRSGVPEGAGGGIQVSRVPSSAGTAVAVGRTMASDVVAAAEAAVASVAASAAPQLGLGPASAPQGGPQQLPLAPGGSGKLRTLSTPALNADAPAAAAEGQQPPAACPSGGGPSACPDARSTARSASNAPSVSSLDPSQRDRPRGELQTLRLEPWPTAAAGGGEERRMTVPLDGQPGAGRPPRPQNLLRQTSGGSSVPMRTIDSSSAIATSRRSAPSSRPTRSSRPRSPKAQQPTSPGAPQPKSPGGAVQCRPPGAAASPGQSASKRATGPRTPTVRQLKQARGAPSSSPSSTRRGGVRQCASAPQAPRRPHLDKQLLDELGAFVESGYGPEFGAPPDGGATPA